MERAVNAPVQVHDLKLFQAAAHLQSGRLDFALLGAADYVALTRGFGESGHIIALSEVLVRQGVIVARAETEVKSLADIRGRRFAFGPPADPVLDVAAREALEQANAPGDQANRGFRDEPLLPMHYPSSKEAARQIAYGGGAVVGVVEKSEYDAYPETGGNRLSGTVAQDNFRVLGITREVRADTIAEGPLLASVHADRELVSQVARFLLDSDETQDVLKFMGLSRFRAPPANVRDEIERLAGPDDSSVAAGHPAAPQAAR
jgi:ABC-type phosphate/phosphonate transport system substrate-binding protein